MLRMDTHTCYAMGEGGMRREPQCGGRERYINKERPGGGGETHGGGSERAFKQQGRKDPTRHTAQYALHSQCALQHVTLQCMCNKATV
jgi:hypothetical protein